ncbi:uncharacterized protein LOC131855167 [Achroia grisella]|uniref:uncharacterized protein LOC131855167 n=1 Tax=Achroia grisella TaxID=688607 RepID=UPI0027D26C8C|nr:uncharacterized protein LOC131855167 [Achroia grisella]
MVARLYWVAPNRGEQFYLRMLLSSFPCRGYADLLTLGGPNCKTFQEAARAVGIANDEEEYEKCIQEAAAFYNGKKLRHFFVLLITNGAPARILWDKFKHLISEDILERQPNDQEDRAYNQALKEIDRLLRKHGSRLQDQGLPVVRDDTTELDRERVEYNNDSLREFVTRWVPLLSHAQKRVFDHVLKLLATDHSCDETPRTLFLDGPSGTGKTLLLKVIVAYVRGILKAVAICTASSGIAAQNYEGGCTAHSMFRLPLEVIDDTSHWSLTNGTQRAELIRESSIIIYDEAPISHKYLVHILDRSLQDLMGCRKAFGGKIMIFAGD